MGLERHRKTSAYCWPYGVELSNSGRSWTRFEDNCCESNVQLITSLFQLFRRKFITILWPIILRTKMGKSSKSSKRSPKRSPKRSKSPTASRRSSGMSKIVTIHQKRYRVVAPSSSPEKKYDVYDESTGRLVTKFGQLPYQQYHDQFGYYRHLDHHDKSRRDNYRKRHVHDFLNDPKHAGYWSARFLW